MNITIGKCKDCTCELNGVLISIHRHDYVHCDKDFFIDGGRDYTRTNAPTESVAIEEIFPILRERVTWTSLYDENMELLETPIKRKLSELSTSHLTKLIEMKLPGLNTPIFEHELKLRNDKV